MACRDRWARIIDLKDNERGLVWIDGRFEQILLPGLHVVWTNVREVRVETVDARKVRFEPGIRDIILPGDMKELLNKVTEAKKAAEASLITRREETAAMRSQANTARLLQDNPTLMRLRELEVLEKVAETSTLNVVLGDKGLADSVLKLV